MDLGRPVRDVGDRETIEANGLSSTVVARAPGRLVAHRLKLRDQLGKRFTETATSIASNRAAPWNEPAIGGTVWGMRATATGM